jgi:Na+-translocating ferredoxin:NAD+ oxidoreductase RnfD subunit
MMKASLALAERRPDELKDAMEKLGQEAPSSRQLMLLRIMGVIAPPQNAPWYMKLRGVLLILLFVIVLLAIGFGVVKLVALPLGGASTGGAMLLGLLLVVVVLGVLVLIGRRRQRRARDAARAQARS